MNFRGNGDPACGIPARISVYLDFVPKKKTIGGESELRDLSGLRSVLLPI